jgi:hypothetical protein
MHFVQPGQKYFKIVNIFTHWPFWSHPDAKTPNPKILKFTILVKDYHFFLNIFFSFSLVSITLQRMSSVYIRSMAPPWGQNLYPKDHEIHNLGRGLPALHHHAFSFSCIHVVSEKMIFLKIGQFFSLGQESWNSQYMSPLT